jgi:hypothetical protein
MGDPQYIAGWFLISGTSENKMDDEMGYHYFRKPPYQEISGVEYKV